MSSVRGPCSGAVALEGEARRGWWLVVEEAGAFRIVAGPFSERVEAGIAAGVSRRGGHGTDLIFGTRRADGGLDRQPSPEDRAWCDHLARQLDRLPDDWDAGLSEDEPLVTLLVEVAAALSETGLPLYDADGPGRELGGAWLTAEPGLDGIVVSWRQHDRMSIDQVHGAAVDAHVHEVMNRALAEVLALRGFDVDAFGGASGHLVRSPSAHRW